MTSSRFVARGACALALTLPVVTVLATSPSDAATVDGAPAGGSASHAGNLYYPFSPAPGTQAAFPSVGLVNTTDAKGFRASDVWLSYSQAADSAAAATANGTIVSHDAARTFLDPRGGDIGSMSMGRLPNGELLSLRFAPETGAGGAALVVTDVSADLGKTWTQRRGAFTPPAGRTLDWLRTSQGFMVLPDGTIITTFYAQLKSDPHTTAGVMQSTDGGRSWTTRGLVVDGRNAAFGGTEADLSPTSDGRLVSVVRGAPESAGLLESWSSDLGRTWTAPVKLNAPTSTVTGAVEPTLQLQPNGQLLLSYGRPGNHLLVSADGKGESWGGYTQLLSNVPASNAEPNWGSSGYTSMVPLSNGRTLVVGDTCAPWGCQPDPLDETYAIWGRQIDAFGPGSGRIDLWTLLKEGKISITGSFVADAKFPETGPNGIVDGSADAHAAAVVTPGSSITVKLDKPYAINRIGVLMAPGVAQSADIQLSADGRAWGKPEVKLRDQVAYSMGYTDITPTVAQYVKINPADKNAMTALTELELYSADTDTFENDPVNAPPRGWTGTSLASVVDVIPTATVPVKAAKDSQKALRLLDMSTDAQARATLPFSARQSVTVDYDAMAVNRQAGFLMDVTGTDATGASRSPWHFSVDLSAGSLSQYVGGAWKKIGSFTPINPSTWYHASVTASTTSATLTINGQTFTAGSPDGGASALDGFLVASSGTQPKGGSFYFDNVQVH